MARGPQMRGSPSGQPGDDFTHFGSTDSDLPAEFYCAMGRVLYRWSQLEATLCMVAVSTMELRWLDAIAQLRGSTGFAIKNLFPQIRKAMQKKGADATSIEVALTHAQTLYDARKRYFHSMWGFVSGPNQIGVGVQEVVKWVLRQFSARNSW